MSHRRENPESELHSHSEGGGSSVSELEPLYTDEAETDDTPTVISRAKAQVVSQQEILAGALRGQKLAHFEMLAPVGVGGMAAVIKARDLQLDRLVALKILPPEMSEDEDAVQRFQHEARAAARLDHENIARVFFCGESKGLHFIAFEFVEGRNLRSLIEKRHRLSVPEGLHYLLQIAAGLVHAANRKVVHRDIKPSNIIITPTGRVKILDMGLARSMTPTEEPDLTRSGVTLGTFDYISPEQALEPRDADERSDIYSLGCTFYHAMTGVPPVPEGTAAKKLQCHQFVDPIDPREICSDIPDEVARILSRMMAKDPRARYQHPEELVQHLLQVTQVSEDSRTPGPMVYVEVPVEGRSTFKPVVTTFFSILALIALIVGLRNVGQNQSQGSFQLAVPKGRAQFPVSKDKAPPPRDVPPQKDRTGTSKPETRPKEGHYSYTVVDSTGKGLRDWLAKLSTAAKPKEIKLILESDLDLTQEGLILEADKLILESSDPKVQRRVTMRYIDSFEGGDRDTWAALTLRANEVQLRHMTFRFETLARPQQDDTLASVLISGGYRHEIEDCQFIQIANLSLLADRTLYSLAVKNESDKPTTVSILRSSFLGATRADRQKERLSLVKPWLGGHTAIHRNGLVQLKIEGCGFSPHNAFVSLQGKQTGSQSGVNVRDCSMMLRDGTALVHLGSSQQEKLQIEHCLLARLSRITTRMPEVDPLTHTLLVLQPGSEGKPRFEIQLNNNAVYGLDGLWGNENRQISQGLAEVKGLRLLSEVPWDEADPMGFLAQLDLHSAFRLTDDKALAHADSPVRYLGLQGIEGQLYVRKSESGSLPKSKARRLIVNPAFTKLRDGEDRSIAVSLDYVQTGDEILIQHKGELRLGSTRITKAKQKITIKPFPGYTPKLILNAIEQDDALFKLYAGTVTFQDLHLELRYREGNLAQTVVSLHGEAQCQFENCLITLNDAAGASFSVVSIRKAVGVGRSTVVTNKTRITLKQSLVRGDGALVEGRHPLTFRLHVADSLVVLTASLLDLKEDKAAARRAMAAEMPLLPEVAVQIQKVTAYLDQSLLQAKAQTLQVLPRLHWNVSDSIFATSTSSTLIELSGLKEVSKQSLSRAFTWSGMNNRFSGFMWMLEQKMIPGTGSGMERPYDSRRWEDLTENAMSSYTKITFEKAPESNDYPKAQATMFRSTEKRGADLSKLPVPTAPVKKLVMPSTP